MLTYLDNSSSDSGTEPSLVSSLVSSPVFGTGLERETLKGFWSAILGTVVEYYDYAVYGFCANLLAVQFFPSNDPTVALLKTYGIFLTGSLFKPMGAVLFGYIGDRFGRKMSLRISTLGMVIPTLLVALLPTYEKIGWLAPFFLCMCRIFQGIFISGESDGVRIFIYELMGDKRPFLANSISNLACMVGIYLGSCVVAIIMRFENIPNIWRVPFLIGGVLGLFVFWSRRYLIETPVFINHAMRLKNTLIVPTEHFLSIFLKNKRAIVSSILLCGSVGGMYHFYLVFFGNFLSQTLAWADPVTVSADTTQVLLIYMLCGPLAGLLADRFGAIYILKMSLKILWIAVILNINMISQGVMSMWVFCFTTIGIAFFATPGFVVLLSKFSVGERYRCISIGHAVGSMLFSGSAPVISLWCWHSTKIAIAPFYYFVFLLIIAYGAILLLEQD